METNITNNSPITNQEDDDTDPIRDIIDYLVRCVNISFKNAHVDEKEVRTYDKIKIAFNLYLQSPVDFLLQFGKYLAPYHISYFENLQSYSNDKRFQECIENLKIYHSDESKHKRVKNRRYKALQKLQEETDYFSEKHMMYRNPLLYEQLVGQYLNDDEIRMRDNIDNDNLTFLNLILETVDQNQMRETKNEQMVEENEDLMGLCHDTEGNKNHYKPIQKKQWGEFETPDTKPSYMPEKRKQNMISAPERNLLRKEFLQEMYNSFIEGRDPDIDYNSIDNDEQYDDLQQVSQDAEDKYFDSEQNDSENLEEHMQLVKEYGRKKSDDNTANCNDPLDVFMKHLNKCNDSS